MVVPSFTQSEELHFGQIIGNSAQPCHSCGPRARHTLLDQIEHCVVGNTADNTVPARIDGVNGDPPGSGPVRERILVYMFSVTFSHQCLDGSRRRGIFVSRFRTFPDHNVIPSRFLNYRPSRNTWVTHFSHLCACTISHMRPRYIKPPTHQSYRIGILP